mmetsp:Transcript_15717/g.39952  ORF Transcript_15717/g.39952 Transcript_15717/m.39952 type:complete len:116 (-) Transcript_15717:1584-1931(-)
MIQNMNMNMNRLNKVECAAQRTAPSIIEGGRGGRNNYRQKKTGLFCTSNTTRRKDKEVATKQKTYTTPEVSTIGGTGQIVDWGFATIRYHTRCRSAYCNSPYLVEPHRIQNARSW